MSRSRDLANLANNASGLETLTVSDITDLTTGISNGNFLTANASVADNDFLRVDGTSIEGRTAAETLSDISGAPLASPTFTGTTNVSSGVTMPAGHIIQAVQYLYTDNFSQSLTGSTYAVMNDGTDDFAVTITTKQANSKIKLSINFGGIVAHNTGSGWGGHAKILRDITGGASNTEIANSTSGNDPKGTFSFSTDSTTYDNGGKSFMFIDSPAQVAGSVIKYKISFLLHSTTGTYTMIVNSNASSSGTGTHGYQGSTVSTFIAEEISV